MSARITLIGNLTRDPELKFGDNGKARCNFSVAVNRGKDENQKTSYFDVTAFGTLAENVAKSLHKGDRVVVDATAESYTTTVATADGEKNIGRVSFTAWSVAPDLSWATAAVTRNPKVGSGNGGGASPASAPASQPASAPAPASDGEDF